MQHRKLLDWLLFAVLVCAWGSSFALLKFAVQSVAPIWIVALRLSVGALVLCSVAAARGVHLRPDLRGLGSFVWLAIIGNLAPFMLITWGAQFIPSGIAGILMAAVPIAVVLLAHVLLRDEPMTRWKAVGVATGFAGIVILMGPQALLGLADTDLSLLAKLAVFAAALCYAVNGVSVRLLRPASAMVRSAGSIAAAAAICLPIALVSAPDGLSGLTVQSALAIVALGLFPTALAALILFRLLESAGASFVSYSNYLVPPFALIVGWLFLAEQPSADAVLGMVVILAGILIATRR